MYRDRVPKHAGQMLALVCAGLVLFAQAGPAEAETMADFMVMQVCTGADGALLKGVAPTDVACLTRRKIQAGETPPYRLRDWPPRDVGCHHGFIVKYNVPLIRNDITRIVSFTDRTSVDGCDGGTDAGGEVARGLSVQWHDDEFGFIMASWSPVAMSSFESPLCRIARGGAARFFHAWILAPAQLPPMGQPGWGVFPSHVATGPAPGPGTQCPPRFNTGFTLWMVDEMSFGNARMTAVVSHHYAQSGAHGASPGQAEQVERTYWTREFGLTRWEKWAREDWIHPRGRGTAKNLAARLFARGRCNEPYSLPADLTPRMQAEKLTGEGTWQQVVSDPKTGERHAWLMTLCEDYTNLVRTPPSATALATPGRTDDAYWRPDFGSAKRTAAASVGSVQ